MTIAEPKSNITLTKETPYLDLAGVQWLSFVRILKKVDLAIMTPHCMVHNICSQTDSKWQGDNTKYAELCDTYKYITECK